MSKSLNKLRDEVFAYAEKQGFHEQQANLGESLMLVVSELSEALEADRAGKWANNPMISTITNKQYEAYVRGTVEEEVADAIIRLCGIAGIYGINLDWHVAAKMKYNSTSPYKHGKTYG